MWNIIFVFETLYIYMIQCGAALALIWHSLMLKVLQFL